MLFAYSAITINGLVVVVLLLLLLLFLLLLLLLLALKKIKFLKKSYIKTMKAAISL